MNDKPSLFYRSHVAILTAAMILPACVGFPDDPEVKPNPATCIVDSDCSDGFVCALGICADPRIQDLGRVHIEIRPPQSSNYLFQQVLDVDPRQSERISFTLTPTVSAVGSIDIGDAGAFFGRINAVRTDSVTGLNLVSSANVEQGAARLALLENSRYSISVYPSDPALPPLFVDNLLRVGAAEEGDLSFGPLLFPDVEGLMLVTGHLMTALPENLDDIVGLPDDLPLPVAGMQVRLLDGSRLASSIATTDETGAFELLVPPDLARNPLQGSLTLEARFPDDDGADPVLPIELGYDRSVALHMNVAPLRSGFGLADLGNIPVGHIPATASVTGTVMGPNGNPVPFAQVLFEADVGANNIFVTAQTKADADGNYQITVPAAAYRLSAIAPVGSSAAYLRDTSLDLTSLDIRNEPQQIHLPARIPVAGTLLDADGLPIAAATLRLTRLIQQNSPAQNNPTYQTYIDDRFTWSFSIDSDVDGYFALDVDDGVYRVNIDPPLGSSLPKLTKIVRISRSDLVQEINDPANPDDDEFLPAALDFQFSPPAVIAGTVLGKIPVTNPDINDDNAGDNTGDNTGNDPNDDGNPQTLVDGGIAGCLVRIFAPIVDENGAAILIGEGITDANGNFDVILPDLDPNNSHSFDETEDDTEDADTNTDTDDASDDVP